jgi:hypothetical protein
VIRPDSPAPASVQGSSVTWRDWRALRSAAMSTWSPPRIRSAEQRASERPWSRTWPPRRRRAPQGLPGDRRPPTWQPPAEMMDGSPAPGDPTTWCRAWSGGRARPDHAPAAGGTVHRRRRRERHRPARGSARCARIRRSRDGETRRRWSPRPPAPRRPPRPPAWSRCRRRRGAAGLNPSASPDVAIYAVYRAGETGDFIHRDHAGGRHRYLDRDVRRARLRYAGGHRAGARRGDPTKAPAPTWSRSGSLRPSPLTPPGGRGSKRSPLLTRRGSGQGSARAPHRRFAGR